MGIQRAKKKIGEIVDKAGKTAKVGLSITALLTTVATEKVEAACPPGTTPINNACIVTQNSPQMSPDKSKITIYNINPSSYGKQGRYYHQPRYPHNYYRNHPIQRTYKNTYPPPQYGPNDPRTVEINNLKHQSRVTDLQEDISYNKKNIAYYKYREQRNKVRQLEKLKHKVRGYNNLFKESKNLLKELF